MVRLARTSRSLSLTTPAWPSRTRTRPKRAPFPGRRAMTLAGRARGSRRGTIITRAIILGRAKDGVSEKRRPDRARAGYHSRSRITQIIATFDGDGATDTRNAKWSRCAGPLLTFSESFEPRRCATSGGAHRAEHALQGFQRSLVGGDRGVRSANGGFLRGNVGFNRSQLAIV